jgi:hypothetical protein
LIRGRGRQHSGGDPCSNCCEGEWKDDLGRQRMKVTDSDHIIASIHFYHTKLGAWYIPLTVEIIV